MHPPGLMATTEPRVEHISEERDSDLSRTQQVRLITITWADHGMTITRPAARDLLRRYEAERLNRPVAPSLRHWIEREIGKAPVKRNRPVAKQGIPKHMRVAS